MPRSEGGRSASEPGSTSTGAETTSWQPSYRRILGGDGMSGDEQWFVGVDCGERTASDLCARRRRQGSRGAPGGAQRRRHRRPVHMVGQAVRRAPGKRARGDRNAAWSGGGDAAGAQGAGVRDQSQAAGSISRPVYGRRGQGRPARCAGCWRTRCAPIGAVFVICRWRRRR